MDLLVKIILTALIGQAVANYLEEPPVKLLSVNSLADRHPAANSELRISIQNGEVRLLISFLTVGQLHL